MRLHTVLSIMCTLNYYTAASVSSTTSSVNTSLGPVDAPTSTPHRHLDTVEDVKREKDAPASTERADSSSASLPPPIYSFCPEHVTEELTLYCETCGELICYHCALKTGKHHNHDYALVKEAFEKYKKEIDSLLDPINRKLVSVNEVLTQFDKDNAEISDQRAAIEADIHDTINELHRVLDVRRTELISHLQQLTESKQKDLAAERNQAETVHVQLSSCQDYMKQSIKTDRWGEALKMKTTVLKQVKELTTTVQPDSLKPNTKADIEFSASAGITDLCRHSGQVSTLASPNPSKCHTHTIKPNIQASILVSASAKNLCHNFQQVALLPDPSKCHATGKGLEVGIVGQTSTAILQAYNSKGEPCTPPVTSLECKLVSDLTGATATGSFKTLEGQNRYEISYQPTIKGRHQLHISIQGQPIRESPFRPAVTLSIMNLGAPIRTIAGVKHPWGIAINHKGEIVVSEQGSGHIFTYTPCGKRIQTIDLQGLEFLGLTLDREGNIIVGEDMNHSIRKYSPEGQLLASVGTKGIGRLQFSHPRDIAINTRNNKVYVADCSNHRIQVLNSDLTFSATFGKQGRSKGQFYLPSGVTCDSAGNVYVADYGDYRVQVFTAEGKFLRMFGKRGEGRGELKFPVGIALDPSSKHVYISEGFNNRISVFTCEGQFVTSFGADIASFNPSGLAVDDYGVVYVCDSNTSIRIF